MEQPESRENRRFTDLKRKMKIAKNVAKVPERRTKKSRKKREKRSSGRWFCRREKFIFGWGVCVVHAAV